MRSPGQGRAGRRAALGTLGACGLLALAFGVGVLPGGTGAHAQIDDARRIKVAERLKQSTVTVLAGRSSGSGFLVAPRGYVVTNAHVASGARRSGRLAVRFSDGSEHPATLLAYDPHHDLAVARIDGAVKVKPLPLGDSDAVKVGQTVLAFGSPFGLEGTLTQGIVSARRDLGAIGTGQVKGVIQTDAPINPGNSGGPLVNTRGEVVGVNTAILSRGGGSNGIGFAVPVSYVKALLGELEQREARAQAKPAKPGPKGRRPGKAGTKRGKAQPAVWLGVMGDDFRARGYEGVRVHQVVEGSPAARAGLLGAADRRPPFIGQLGIPWTGHIILALDSEPVRTMDELRAVLARYAPGDELVVTVTVGPGIVTGETVVELAARPRELERRGRRRR
ncbi:MAG: trypsin-like peptidase domain-containing protein [Myxococcales bacterium]|nr:trypsin-like peptidase domain-containing protein [Myxococcales bacterium]